MTRRKGTARQAKQAEEMREILTAIVATLDEARPRLAKGLCSTDDVARDIVAALWIAGFNVVKYGRRK
jgi:hypothetical protein